MPTPLQIAAAVVASKQVEAGAVTAGRAVELVAFIQACVDNSVDLVGPGLEGLAIKGGLVWFHSPDGKPTGVPTAAQVRAVLDIDAAKRLYAVLIEKFNP